MSIYIALLSRKSLVRSALNTLVSREKPGFQTLSKGLIVLLCTEVVRQGVLDHGAVHSCCVADLRRCPPTTSVTGVQQSTKYCGTLPCRHQCMMTPSLYVTPSATSSQCKSSCLIMVVMTLLQVCIKQCPTKHFSFLTNFNKDDYICKYHVNVSGSLFVSQRHSCAHIAFTHNYFAREGCEVLRSACLCVCPLVSQKPHFQTSCRKIKIPEWQCYCVCCKYLIL